MLQIELLIDFDGRTELRGCVNCQRGSKLNHSRDGQVRPEVTGTTDGERAGEIAHARYVQPPFSNDIERSQK
jgi:hypothetical protein